MLLEAILTGECDRSGHSYKKILDDFQNPRIQVAGTRRGATNSRRPAGPFLFIADPVSSIEHPAEA
jgi:hypothetical protein